MAEYEPKCCLKSWNQQQTQLNVNPNLCQGQPTFSFSQRYKELLANVVFTIPGEVGPHHLFIQGDLSTLSLGG